MCLIHPYSFAAKSTRHVKGHSDGPAVHCDRSGQVAKFNRNVRSRRTIVVTNRNLQHETVLDVTVKRFKSLYFVFGTHYR